MAISFLACSSTEEVPLDRPERWPYDLGDLALDPQRLGLWNAWSALTPPTPPDHTDLDEGWTYRLGSPTETLATPVGERPADGEAVSLPHRVEEPDRALWYWRALTLPDGALLLVDADDGAQVYLDEENLTPPAGEAAYLPAFGDERTLTIRVLNNAMGGGLRTARLFDPLEYADFLERRSLYETFTLLTRKALLREASQAAPLMELLAQGSGPGLLGWPDSLPPFLAGPLVQPLGRDSLSVLMELLPDAPSCRLLLFNTRDSSLVEVAGESRGELMEFELPDLPAGTEMRYRIDAGRFQTRPYALRVPDRDQRAFTFTAWADSQGGWPVFSRLVRQMVAQRPAFSVGIGDLTAQGWADWQWSGLLASLEPLGAEVPVYLIPGNHDYDGYYRDLKAAHFHRFTRGGRYRAWTWGPARFVALDPNASFPIGLDEAQRRWLEREIGSRAWRRAEWRFLLVHQPPYSQGWPGYQGEAFLREWVEAHAQRAGIDFVLSGHTHDYERLTRTFGDQKTTFFILGGAGGKLEPPVQDASQTMDRVIGKNHYARFEVGPEQVVVTIFNLEDQEIDRFVREAKE